MFGISTVPAGSRSSILTIESVQYEHAGNFTCKAHNKAGKAEYIVGLQVNGYLNFFYLLNMFKIPKIPQKFKSFFFSLSKILQ